MERERRRLFRSRRPLVGLTASKDQIETRLKLAVRIGREDGANGCRRWGLLVPVRVQIRQFEMRFITRPAEDLQRANVEGTESNSSLSRQVELDLSLKDLGFEPVVKMNPFG